MTDQQRSAIRAAYLDGADIHEIAVTAGVAEHEAETYLRWWCDRACPGADIEESPPATPEQRAEWRRYIRALATGQDAQWEGEASGQ